MRAVLFPTCRVVLKDAPAADGCEISFEHLLCYYLDPYADLFGESMALPQVLFAVHRPC